MSARKESAAKTEEQERAQQEAYWRRQVLTAQSRVERAQEELDKARQALEDLPDEARQAGALPGWLR